MKKIIITNNPVIVLESSNCIFLRVNYMDILVKARDYIHLGYKLLIHPLYGSLKPDETPYRTLILNKENSKDTLDYKSLEFIEKAIHSSEKFQNNNNTKNYSQKTLKDFQVIDFSLVESVIKK